MTWEWMPIGDLLVRLPNQKVVQQGWSPKCHAYPATPGNWGVLKTTAIQAGRFEPEHNKELPEGLAPRPNIEVEVGDLLLTCAGPRARCGIPALVRASPGRLMMSGKMYRLRPDERLDARFLELYLLSDEAQKRIDVMKTGISDSGLNLTHGRFVQLPVPVPPLEEQRRIVAILEDQLSRLDAADTYLRTASWHSSVLSDRLLSSALENTPHDAIPFRELLSSGLANGRSVPTADVGFPVLRLTALRDRRIDLAQRKIGAWTAGDAERFLVNEGDFLIARGNGSLHLVGRGGLVDAKPDRVAYPDTLIRARPRPDVLDSAYLSLVWNSPTVRRQIERAARTTAGIYKVNQKDLGAFNVPLPSLEDQKRIASSVASDRDALDRTGLAISNAQHRSATLRRALLAAAFSGRLTGSSTEMSEVAGMIDG